MTTEQLTLGLSLVVTGALIILVSLPLLKDQIRPNAIYGIRMAKSFESEENWYKMNRYGAKQMIRWAAVMIVFGLITFFFPLQGNSSLITLIALSPALFLCVPVFLIHRYSKTL
ncbi:MAG: hypothetical protein JWN98_2196 [Abditibacteriota bacterium]|nr:hypothetical protein [Abditibacteriota bacterium]